MKKYLMNIACSSLIMFTACNKESLIEGRLPTNPVTINLNEEIPRGFKKNINFNIEGVNYTINTNYYYQISGNTEVRQVFIYNISSSNYITFFPNGNSIGVIETGREINSLFSNTQIIYSGMFLNSINQLSNSIYSYYTFNNVKIDIDYYIPFKTYQTNAQKQKFICGWIQAKVSPSKMIIYKCVYRKIGDLKAGQE